MICRALIAALTPRPMRCSTRLHGRFGEDGTIQGVLDYLGIPYTHSGVRASALAMDKAAAKAVFAAAGLPVAPHRIIDIAELADHDPLPPPYVVKPVNEGSSVGVYIVRPGDNGRAESCADGIMVRAMVEQFIPGRRAHRLRAGRPCSVGHGNPLRGKFYDYHAKYAAGGSRHVLPARIPDEVTRRQGYRAGGASGAGLPRRLARRSAL